MSLQSWKEEFYPVESVNVPEKDAVAHSLQKWIGLRQENLSRHGVCKYGYGNSIFYSSERFDVDSLSCALCHYHIRLHNTCAECPLAITIDMACDGTDAYDGEEFDGLSPYVAWTRFGDPEPMIQALKDTMERLNNE